MLFIRHARRWDTERIENGVIVDTPLWVSQSAFRVVQVFVGYSRIFGLFRSSVFAIDGLALLGVFRHVLRLGIFDTSNLCFQLGYLLMSL